MANALGKEAQLNDIHTLTSFLTEKTLLFITKTSRLMVFREIIASIGFWRWCITHRITGFSDFVQWARLDLSKGTNRIGVFLHLGTETDPVSETSCFSCNYLESGRWTKSENPVILWNNRCLEISMLQMIYCYKPIVQTLTYVRMEQTPTTLC
jgi:hypothetical protein